jgi:hypothetical protein
MTTIREHTNYTVQGCQIFLLHDTKTGKMIQMNTECNKHFQSKALLNVPKLGFFGLKTNHLATLTLTSLRRLRLSTQGCRT